jgi:predicted Holliday junction resolvase-like endonuclease
MDTSLATLATGIAIGVIVVLLGVVAIVPAYTRRIREHAIQQSRAVTRGQIYEQLVPYLPEFEFNPKDAQFLGKPVDFLVFDGLDEGEVERIVFVEVKTGGSALTTRERRVRDAIRRGRVEWKEIRIAGAPSINGAERPVLK